MGFLSGLVDDVVGAAGGWVGPAISAGASLIGDFMGKSGQHQTNVANLQMQQQMEQWQQQMSDTAMQRRVSDLKAAGLNPLLAIGQGGASTPGIAPVQLGNPNASFQNLGNQATSAIQLQTQQAQIDALKAQAQNYTSSARNTDANTDVVLPAQVKNIQAQTGYTNEQAQTVHQNLQLLNYSISSGIAKNTIEQNNAQNVIKTHLMQADQQERQDTLVQLIRARNDENYAIAIGARNIAHANDTEWGKIMSFFSVSSPAISAASSAAKIAGSLAP